LDKETKDKKGGRKREAGQVLPVGIQLLKSLVFASKKGKKDK
jgi:hypothetical protein